MATEGKHEIEFTLAKAASGHEVDRLSIKRFKARFKYLNCAINVRFLGFGLEVGYLFLRGFTGLRKLFAGRFKFMARQLKFVLGGFKLLALQDDGQNDCYEGQEAY